jgi:DNA modification methylase
MIAILNADARQIPLADESVNCVVTSPPYWGLRDYGLPPQIWGGDPECDHTFGDEGRRQRGGPHGNGVMLEGGRAVIHAQAATRVINTGARCGCGAWRGMLGLEPTPELYVEHLVQIFREVRRVLRRDGTLWLNIGDCYATGGGKVGDAPGGGKQGDRWKGKTRVTRDGSHAGTNTAMAALGPMTQPNRMPIPGLKPKDLVMIPARVALALQADGWWLRSDVIEEVEFYCPCGCGYIMAERIWRHSQDREIVWAKPNAMCESVTDRPTKAHEYVFLLAKSKRYYYQARRVGNTRTRRSVWTIATQPYPGPHFATFPPKLVEPCILAGCPRGGMVLDPFAGSGTVGCVAGAHGRSAVLVDLNARYITMQVERCSRGIQIEASLSGSAAMEAEALNNPARRHP